MKPVPPQSEPADDRPGLSERLIHLPLTYYIQRLAAGRYFSFTKINHGFWERLIGLDQDPQGVRSRSQKHPGSLFYDDFADELTQMLGSEHCQDDDFYLGVSPYAFTCSDRLHSVPLEQDLVEEKIDQCISAGRRVVDGVVWKDAVIAGEFKAFLQAIRPFSVLFVGPDLIPELERKLGCRQFTHLKIHHAKARFERQQILDEIKTRCEADQKPDLVLIQAGTLATWLTFHLHGLLRETFIIDVGRAIDILAPETIVKQPWGQLFRNGLSDSWGFDLKSPNSKRLRHLLKKESLRDCADNRIYCADRDLITPASSLDTEGQIPFIENKPIDDNCVAQLLNRSRSTNCWTNFGPVSRLLERAIHSYAGLTEDQAVVACASGTAALHALVSLYHFIGGGPLRWVVSAFGFHCTRQGPLSDAQVLDCDPQGLLSIEQLKKLPPESFDGVVVTNLFGLGGDMKPYREFCERHDKYLIIDSAAALDAPRTPLSGEKSGEIFSFHQTKPWGMGEGGAVAVPLQHETVFRSLINFGLYKKQPVGGYATNAKLSDISAAYILQRLIHFHEVSPRYHAQYRRLHRLALSLGFKGLETKCRRDGEKATPACLPLISPDPITEAQLNNPRMVLRKYYKPLAADKQAANDLYRRIVNVPTHPGVAGLSTDILSQSLGKLLVEHPPKQG